MKLVSRKTSIPRLALCSLIALAALGGSAFAEKIIHQFNSAAGDGARPIASLVARNGKLYGTTVSGGDFGGGTVFELSPPSAQGGSWTQTILHSFPSSSDDASCPNTAVVFDRQGNMYGMGCEGGIFKLTPPSPPETTWTETVIYHLRLINIQPQGVTLGLGGNLFALTSLAGANLAGGVFELKQLADGSWMKIGVYSFVGNDKGNAPRGTLVADSAGNLYGTTAYGGDFSCFGGCGTVFELQPPATAGGAWTETVLYAFKSGITDGNYPQSGVTLDRSGNLYGTTYFGGTSNYGTVFEVSPPAVPGGPWTESVLHSFDGLSGIQPYGGIVLDSVGNLYGTAPLGGVGYGTVFRLSSPSSPGAAWIETTLHQFGTGFFGLDDGNQPLDKLVFGPYGALYGTTYFGLGSSVDGTVFSVHP